ncbi:hypothetical protein GQ55_9G511500 [Panicum hallii var. hallii]|uniref:Uncharacterized protein n=1 Tax=Panicum hallii var. hallii TaxID=1504633 RepID=A0A2T7CDU7_9POAL|nr:hypothetical protein GQ55_9G511500 [Panicum hallii var. hallii]
MMGLVETAKRRVTFYSNSTRNRASAARLCACFAGWVEHSTNCNFVMSRMRNRFCM